MAPMPVILDTDIGTDIDDTWALALLLRCPELDLKLVLSGVGDTTYRAALAAKLLALAGRSDVPVGVGVPQDGDTLRLQQRWLADFTLADYPGPVHADGVGALIAAIMDSPEPVTLIAIGPLPNIAAALEREPRIAPKCRFVGMFGSVDRGYGDEGPVRENNVLVDVPACRAVFAAPWRELLITPLDTCGLVVLEGARYRRVCDSPDPLLRAVIANYRQWAEVVPWGVYDAGVRTSTLFDVVAVYMAYAADLLHYEPLRLTITDEGLTKRDPLGYPVQAALAWRDLGAFYDHVVARLVGQG